MEYRHIFTILILVFCQSCSTSYRFKNSDGTPLEDVIVISSQYPYILTSEKHWAGMSDSNGVVTNIPDGKIMIFKAGYYPAQLNYYYPYVVPYESADISHPKQLILFKFQNQPKAPVYRLRGESIQSYFWQKVSNPIDKNFLIEAYSPIDLLFPYIDPLNSLVKISSKSPDISFAMADAFYWSKQLEIPKKSNTLILKRGQTFFILDEKNKPELKVRINNFGSCSSPPDQIKKLSMEFLICKLPGTDLMLVPDISGDIGELSFFLDHFNEKAYIGSVDFNTIKGQLESFSKLYKK